MSFQPYSNKVGHISTKFFCTAAAKGQKVAKAGSPEASTSTLHPWPGKAISTQQSKPFQTNYVARGVGVQPHVYQYWFLCFSLQYILFHFSHPRDSQPLKLGSENGRGRSRYGMVTTRQVGQTATCSQEPRLRFTSSPSVTLVITYKSLLKDVRQGYVNSSLRQTRSSLRAMTTPSPYEGVRRADWHWRRERECVCVWKRVTRVEVERKQRKINSYSVSLVSSVQFSSSCCHLLKIITERDDWQVNLLSFSLYRKVPLKQQQLSNSHD